MTLFSTKLDEFEEDLCYAMLAIREEGKAGDDPLQMDVFDLLMAYLTHHHHGDAHAADNLWLRNYAQRILHRIRSLDATLDSFGVALFQAEGHIITEPNFAWMMHECDLYLLDMDAQRAMPVLRWKQ